MKSSLVTSQDYYNTLIKGYVDLGDKVVMENNLLQEAIFNSIDFTKNSKINILDLGIGTASTSYKILNKYPNSFVVGIDFSDEMINVAKHTLKDFSGRFNIIKADINGLDLKQYGSFDVVISAVTIHNIPDEAKIDLFDRIFNCLNKNGLFINGDFVAGEDDVEEMQTRHIYKSFLENNLSGDILREWLIHAFEFDTPMKLSEHNKFLKKCGFISFDVVWKYPREVVYVAKK